MSCHEPFHPEHEGLSCEEWEFEFSDGGAPLSDRERTEEIAELESLLEES